VLNRASTRWCGARSSGRCVSLVRLVPAGASGGRLPCRIGPRPAHLTWWAADSARRRRDRLWVAGLRAARVAMHSSGGERPAPGRRSDPVEAEGRLIRGMAGRVGSSPENAGTVRHCQAGRVRQARRRGISEEAASESPSSAPIRSNLADTGWAAANSGGTEVACRVPDRDVVRPGGHGEGLRRTRGWPLGHSWVSARRANPG
jgi:hypothetical protein